MASDSITRGRIQGAVGMAAVGVMIGVAALALRPGLAPASICTSAGSTCVVPVVVNPGGALSHCNLKLSSEVSVRPQYTAIEWQITTPGFSFVSGGHAVLMLNDAGDFAPGGSAAATFKLQRPTSPVSQRVYTYVVNVQSAAGEFCMVPTLPRIKNE